MKKIFFILTLFLVTMPASALEKEVFYEVEVTVCDSSSIQTSINNQTYSLQLFNIEYLDKEAAIDYVCREFEERSVVVLIDKNVRIQGKELYVWAFVDGTLIQQRLIEENLAKLQVANPNYLYTSELIQENLSVLNPIERSKTYDDKNYRGLVYLIIMGGVITALLVINQKYLKENDKNE